MGRVISYEWLSQELLASVHISVRPSICFVSSLLLSLHSFSLHSFPSLHSFCVLTRFVSLLLSVSALVSLLAVWSSAQFYNWMWLFVILSSFSFLQSQYERGGLIDVNPAWLWREQHWTPEAGSCSLSRTSNRTSSTQLHFTDNVKYPPEKDRLLRTHLFTLG